MSSTRIRYITVACTIVALLVSCLTVGAVVRKPLVKKPIPKKIIKPALKKPSVLENELPKLDKQQPNASETTEVSGQLVISPTSETGAQLYNSWPMILGVSLWRKLPTPDKDGKLPALDPIVIKAKQGSWREALLIEIKDASGKKVEWPVHPVKNVEGSLTLGVDDTAKAEWWLEPLETQGLAAGQYEIAVSFDPKLVDGLPEAVAMDTFYLTVAKEPSPLDSEMAFDKQIYVAMLAMVKDDSKSAMELIDKLLGEDPESIGGNRLKSALLLREGKKREAVSALDKAMGGYSDKFPGACPPAGLIAERDRILQDMEPETVKPDESED